MPKMPKVPKMPEVSKVPEVPEVPEVNKRTGIFIMGEEGLFRVGGNGLLGSQVRESPRPRI